MGTSRILRWYRDRKTAHKLLLGFLAVAALVGTVGVAGLAQLGTANGRMQGLYDASGDVAHVNDAREAFQRSRALAYRLLITPKAQMSEGERQLREAWQQVDEAMASYRESGHAESGQAGHAEESAELVAAFDEAWGPYRRVVEDKLLPRSRAGDAAGFYAVAVRDAVPLATAIDESLEKVHEAEHAEAKESMEQARHDYASARKLIVGLVVLAFALAVALSLGIGRLVSVPLRRTADAIRGLAEGRLDQRLPVDSRDEVGEIAAALNETLRKLATAMRRIGENAGALAASAEEMSAVSSQMSGSAQESAAQANVVSAAAEQVSRSVQTVAAGTEEMGASIREIAKSASDASSVAAAAVRVAEDTNVAVSKLGESSTEIGNVIKVINSIAEQTNLLALNATIEAARAGEAGKGFAVVASEVKELAQETGKATEDIARRIEAIQGDTTGAVAAIGRIGEIVERINDTQATIASAVEQQTATTNEIGRNVAEAATGSSEIAENIAGVARAASHTTSGAGSTAEAAEELSRMAGELQQLVAGFRY